MRRRRHRVAELRQDLLVAHRVVAEARELHPEVGPDLLPGLQAALDSLENVPATPHVLLVDGPSDGADGVLDLEELLAASPATPIARELLGARVLFSGGTTGRPTYIGLTPHDVGVWREAATRAFWANGLRPGQRIPLVVSPFVVAASYADAFEQIGTSIPIGVNMTDRVLADRRLLPGEDAEQVLREVVARVDALEIGRASCRERV